MIKNLSMLLLGLACAGCNSFSARPDPANSPFDTLNHSLLVTFCGQTETSIACSLASDELTDEKIFRVHSPFSGDLLVYGCGVDQKFLIQKPGDFDFKLPNLISLGVRGNCILDLEFNFRVPNYYPRGIRNRIAIDRRGPGETPAKLSYGKRSFEGAAAIKVRQGFESGTPAVVHVATGSTTGGYFEVFGCGHGITEPRKFTASGFDLDLSELTKIPSEQSECFLFGWAIDGQSLNDLFSISLTVFGKTDSKLAGAAHVENKKLCFTADKTVSLVTYGSEVSYSLDGCFKLTDEKIISFYTMQGRALHGSIEVGGVQWKQ